MPYKNLAMDIYRNLIRHVYNLHLCPNHVSTSQEFQYA